MKLLILNYEYPPLGGGAGVISRQIAEGLAAKGHEVSVLTTWFKGEKENGVAENGKPLIIRLPSKRKAAFRSNPSEMLSWMKASQRFLRDRLKECKYDVVFANFTLPGGGVARWIKRTFGIPYVILSHGHDIPWFFPRQMFFYHLLTYFHIRSICHDASALFVQSGDMLRNAKAFLGRENEHKIRLVHNGADFQLFFPDTSKLPKSFTILFAGRLVKQKGPILFLKAIQTLLQKELPFQVTISGDGPMRKQMEAFVNKNKLQERVKFNGWLDREHMAILYREAHVMVAPSLNEGMSMALNEALASGLYTFTTPVSCNEDLIIQGVNGEIVAMNDSMALARQIENYYLEKFKLQYTVPDDAVQQFVKAYAWDVIVSKYERVLNEIIASETNKACSISR